MWRDTMEKWLEDSIDRKDCSLFGWDKWVEGRSLGCPQVFFLVSWVGSMSREEPALGIAMKAAGVLTQHPLLRCFTTTRRLFWATSVGHSLQLPSGLFTELPLILAWRLKDDLIHFSIPQCACVVWSSFSAMCTFAGLHGCFHSVNIVSLHVYIYLITCVQAFSKIVLKRELRDTIWNDIEVDLC